MNRKIVLASASPRRRELLEQIGLEFGIAVSEIDEHRLPGETPDALVKRLALEKASSVFTEGNVVIAADTVVAIDGEILGKPVDCADAKRMLWLLSGRSHFVYSGFCVLDGEKMIADVVTTEVFFRDLTEDEIDDYIESGEPMDKAGAYGIQGKAAKFISGIHGDYYNVVGLPLCRLTTILSQEFGCR